MTSLWRARIYETRALNPSRGLAWATGLIAFGLVLLALLQNFFALAATGMGLGFLALWAHAVFTSRIKRAQWQRIGLVGGVFGIAIGYALWRGSPIPAVAAGAIITLAVRAYGAVRTPSDADSPGFAAYLRALMLISYAGLVFVWPRLSVYVLVLVAAGVVIYVGGRTLLKPAPDLREQALSIRDDATCLKKVRLSRLHLTGRIAMAGVIVLAITGSFFILGGAPEREPGAAYKTGGALPPEVGELITFEAYDRGVPDGAQAWLILYSTRDATDQMVAGSAVVVAPKERPDAPLPTVTIAPGTNGVAAHCAPSLKDNVFATGHEQVLIDTLFENGWAGVVTDYVGLGTDGAHAYLDGETAAKNVLDARSAAAQLSDLNLDDETVIWGHSQGGGAALWAAAIADEYAPQLRVAGVAAAAPAADLKTIAADVSDTTAGKIITSYLAVSWQEEFDFDVDQLRTPGYSQVVKLIADRCFEGRDAIANLADASQLSSPIIAQTSHEFDELLEAKTPPAHSAMPVLLTQGEADQLINKFQQDAFVASQRAAGQEIDYRTYADLDHMPLVGLDSPYIEDLVTWTQERLQLGEDHASSE